MIEIDRQLSIPEEELRYITSRSSGPGGQNVNKVETRVTLLFDLDASPSLDDEQKERLRRRLRTRINREGVLRVVAQKHRTQGANREAARERFVELLRRALARAPRRKPTRVPAAVRERRLEEKRRRGRLKRERREPVE